MNLSVLKPEPSGATPRRGSPAPGTRDLQELVRAERGGRRGARGRGQRGPPGSGRGGTRTPVRSAASTRLGSPSDAHAAGAFWAVATCNRAAAVRGKLLWLFGSTVQNVRDNPSWHLFFWRQ
ncbi:uncharacterized protein LOC144340879 [Macaca mulatta]